MGTPQEPNDQDHANRGEAAVMGRKEPKEPTCGNCRFMRSRHTTSYEPFECRINPPPPASSEDQEWSYWPPVVATDWCGCHQPKPTPWPNV